MADEVRKLEAERERVEGELKVHRNGSPGNQRQKIAAQLAEAEGPRGGGNARSLRQQLADSDQHTIKPMRSKLAAVATRRAEIAAEQGKLDTAKLKP